MNRREVLTGLAGGLMGLPALGFALKVDAPTPDQVYFLKIADDVPFVPENGEVILNQWKLLWPEGKAPRLVILTPGMDVRFALSGKHFLSKKLGDVEVTYSCQTLAELKELVDWDERRDLSS